MTDTGFDFDDLDLPEDGAWLHLSDPSTDAPLYNVRKEPVRLRLLGEDSPQFRAKEKEFLNRRIEKMARGRAKVGSAEQLDAEAIEMLVTCTVGWEGFILKGEPWAFSKDAARQLFTSERWRWVNDQANRFIADRKHFLVPAKTS